MDRFWLVASLSAASTIGEPSRAKPKKLFAVR